MPARRCKVNRSSLSVVVLCLALVSLGTTRLESQNDPGPRPGPAAAGSSFPTLNINEQNFFNQAQLRFQEIDSVSGNIPGEAGVGLGPTFNGNSCAQCHAQPTIGGSSPGLTSPQNSIQNPQVALATLDGAANSVPSFITANGPVREARFVKNANGSLDGGVHGLYTIAGRSDAVGCTLGQPDFATALSTNNVIFRIPTPLFGLGLVEATPDSALQANLASTQSARAALKIGGVFNTSGNDGTITRFGWKAQNKSLAIFAGEAYNVEQGVSNETFPNERSAVYGMRVQQFAGRRDQPPQWRLQQSQFRQRDRDSLGDVVGRRELCRVHPAVGAGHARSLNRFDPERRRAVQLDRLRTLSLTVAHDWTVDLHWHVQRDL